MTITNGYCTAEDLKSWLGFVDGDDDLLLEASINTASPPDRRIS